METALPHVLNAAVLVMAVVLSAWTAQRELGGATARHAAVQGLAALATLVGVILMGQGLQAALHIGALSSVCLAIARIDNRHFLIPDVLVIAVLAIAIVSPGRLPALEMAAGAFSLGAMFVAVRVIYAGVRQVEGLGLGDVKLAVAMGATLGLQAGLLSVVLATLLTTLWMATPALHTSGAQMTLRTKAPFGVGLAGALVLGSVIAGSLT